MITCVHLAIAFVAFIIFMEWKKWKINKNISNFFGPNHWPVIGLLHFRMHKAVQQLKMQMLNMTGPRLPIRFWIGYNLLIFPTDPDDLKTILNSPQCINKASHYSITLPNGLLQIEGDQWKMHRRLLNPCLSNAFLKTCFPNINAAAKQLCDALKTIKSDGDFFPHLVTAVLNQLIAVLYNSKYKLQAAEGFDMYQTVMRIEYLWKKRSENFWYHADFIYQLTASYREEKKLLQKMSNFIAKVSHNENEKLEKLWMSSAEVPVSSNNKVHLFAKIAALLHENKISKEVANENLEIFLIAGIVTTITSIHCTLIMLAIYPEYQEKVVAELDSLFATSDEIVTPDQTTNLIYTEMVLRESMRLFPSLPMMMRETTAAVQLKHGIIPEHTTIVIMIRWIGRDKKFWGPQADAFDPERFCPDLIADVPAYSHLPFSKGPRNCIGSSYGTNVAKIFLAHILRNFHIKTNLKLHEVCYKYAVTAHIGNIDPIQLERRDF